MVLAGAALPTPLPTLSRKGRGLLLSYTREICFTLRDEPITIQHCM